MSVSHLHLEKKDVESLDRPQCPSSRTMGEPTPGRTDPDFVNDVSEKEQRRGAKVVPGYGHQEHINISQLWENVFQEHQTLKEKELEMGPKASHGYGGKFGVEQDRMDKSALGHEYQSKLSKFCLQLDSIWGFGGDFGVQWNRVDQPPWTMWSGGRHRLPWSRSCDHTL